jgi:hypothetical protein
MDEELKKRVDENWKDQLKIDKHEAATSKEPHHEPTFTIFVSSLSMQAMIAMGKLENPMTGKHEINLEQARFLIDTLAIIDEKTKGNLTHEEDALLNEALFNLRMMYVEAKKKK